MQESIIYIIPFTLTQKADACKFYYKHRLKEKEIQGYQRWTLSQ